MQTKKRVRAFVWMLILISMLLLLFTVFQINIKPNIIALCRSRASIMGGDAVNSAVAEILEENKITYSDLVIIGRDTNGAITSVQSNTIMMNKLNSEISMKVYQNIAGLDPQTLRLHIGNVVTGTPLTSGWGPTIPIKLVPMGLADINFTSSFTSEGINQTRHEVSIQVTVEITSIFPGIKNTHEMVRTIPIAQTIIVGAVPDTYTNFNGNAQESEDFMLNKG